MKKASLLFLCSALLLGACTKDPVPETPSADAALKGENVDLSGISLPDGARKIFVLNEGGMGSNNSTLDFLRISDATYVTGAFKKMNPAVGGGLGDVGNDIAVHGDEVWMAICNSGIVEVVSAKDETEIAAIKVPTPRHIAFDDNFAYVSSWAGAYATYTYDDKGNSTLTGSANPKGALYRINLSTKKVDAIIEVGYQPEGVACYGGKVYVANSGGISSQLPPNYAYDNTVSIVDASAFKVTGTTEVQVNLKDAYSDGTGRIYFTTLGNYWDVHSGLYMIEASKPDKAVKLADYVSVSAFSGDTVYWIGAENEFDWSAPKTWIAKKCKSGTVSPWSISVSETVPYGLSVFGDVAFITDAGDYFNPGTFSCYAGGSKKWSVTAGVCPGHFAIW